MLATKIDAIERALTGFYACSLHYPERTTNRSLFVCHMCVVSYTETNDLTDALGVIRTLLPLPLVAVKLLNDLFVF